MKTRAGITKASISNGSGNTIGTYRTNKKGITDSKITQGNYSTVAIYHTTNNFFTNTQTPKTMANSTVKQPNVETKNSNAESIIELLTDINTSAYKDLISEMIIGYLLSQDGLPVEKKCDIEELHWTLVRVLNHAEQAKAVRKQ